MTSKSVTREELVEAVRLQLGFSRTESIKQVQQVLDEITANLAAGETVRLSGFGTFTVREKGRRIGRNPKTGVEFPIEPRRVITFNPSQVLKAYINRKDVERCLR